MPRCEILSKKDERQKLPEIAPFGYLLDLMGEAGGYSAGLTWLELQAWRCEMEIKLGIWEKEIIHRLSHIFQSAVKKYNGTKIMDPVSESKLAEQRRAVKPEGVGSRLKHALRATAPSKSDAKARPKRKSPKRPK